MLSKPNRLPSSLISQILRDGRRIQASNLQLVYRKSTESHPRFAVVVSTKVDKRAVVRNRLKRLVREALRETLGSLTSGVDGVIFVRRPFLEDPQSQATQAVIELLRRAGII